MRRSTLLAGLGALAACAHRDAAAPPRPTTGRPVRLVALGDSLAFGTGASTPERAFLFRAYLRVLAAHPGSEIDNLAIGGSTAADVLRLQAPRLAHVPADAVIVCVGGNDVTRRVDPAAFAASYARLTARVRAYQPHAAIVCCGVPDVARSPLFTGSDKADVERFARADDDAVRHVATRSGAAFVDLRGATRNARDPARFLSEDRFHPSDDGYAILADVLAPVLLRALAR